MINPHRRCSSGAQSPRSLECNGPALAATERRCYSSSASSLVTEFQLGSPLPAKLCDPRSQVALGNVNASPPSQFILDVRRWTLDVFPIALFLIVGQARRLPSFERQPMRLPYNHQESPRSQVSLLVPKLHLGMPLSPKLCFVIAALRRRVQTEPHGDTAPWLHKKRKAAEASFPRRPFLILNS
jgi:hypothetical protein